MVVAGVASVGLHGEGNRDSSPDVAPLTLALLAFRVVVVVLPVHGVPFRCGPNRHPPRLTIHPVVVVVLPRVPIRIRVGSGSGSGI
jgi:hypothetical protein